MTILISSPEIPPTSLSVQKRDFSWGIIFQKQEKKTEKYCISEEKRKYFVKRWRLKSAHVLVVLLCFYFLYIIFLNVLLEREVVVEEENNKERRKGILALSAFPGPSSEWKVWEW